MALRLLTTGDRLTEWLIVLLGPLAVVAIAIREWRVRHSPSWPG